jgi:hypothetical protein
MDVVSLWGLVKDAVCMPSNTEAMKIQITEAVQRAEQHFNSTGLPRGKPPRYGHSERKNQPKTHSSIWYMFHVPPFTETRSVLVLSL